jgi:hypothetical protein
MNDRSPWIPFVVALAFLASAALAVDRYLAVHFSKRAVESALTDVREARAQVERNPASFGTPPPAAAQSALKSIIQQTGARYGITVAFLSEGDKDAGQGVREKQAVARLVVASHGKLVPYLDELERVSGGARVRELHLRPSRDTNGVYQEVEFVLARPLATEEGGR